MRLLRERLRASLFTHVWIVAVLSVALQAHAIKNFDGGGYKSYGEFVPSLTICGGC